MGILGVHPENIVTVGHNKSSAATIHNSIKSAYDPYTADEFDELLNQGENALDENVNTIIIDEVGGIGGNKLGGIAQKLHKLKAKKPNLRVIILGDPNQLTADAGTKLPVEFYKLPDLEGL
jgi:hypothetical protein